MFFPKDSSAEINICLFGFFIYSKDKALLVFKLSLNSFIFSSAEDPSFHLHDAGIPTYIFCMKSFFPDSVTPSAFTYCINLLHIKISETFNSLLFYISLQPLDYILFPKQHKPFWLFTSTLYEANHSLFFPYISYFQIDETLEWCKCLTWAFSEVWFHFKNKIN